jgi:hypothetical protein
VCGSVIDAWSVRRVVIRRCGESAACRGRGTPARVAWSGWMIAHGTWGLNGVGICSGERLSKRHAACEGVTEGILFTGPVEYFEIKGADERVPAFNFRVDRATGVKENTCIGDEENSAPTDEWLEFHKSHVYRKIFFFDGRPARLAVVETSSCDL